MSWLTKTAQSVLYDARALINQLNRNGTVISSDNNDMKTLETDGIRYINMGSREVFRESKYTKSFEVSRKLIPNLLGTFSNFEKVDFIGSDQSYPENGVEGAKAYYFEVDSDATIYIEEYNGVSWVALETISITTDVPVRKKGLITASDSSYPIRIRFSGTTFYRHQNRCLYSYPFKDVDSVPEYRPWVPIELPVDFAEIDEIITEYPVRQYSQDSFYKMEGFNTLYVNFYYEGNFRIIYYVQVTEVTTGTDLVYLPNQIAVEFLNNFVAARLANRYNPDLVNYFEGKANELMFKATQKGPSSEEKITDVYFGGVYG